MNYCFQIESGYEGLGYRRPFFEKKVYDDAVALVFNLFGYWIAFTRRWD